jgi:hypothetical protein
VLRIKSLVLLFFFFLFLTFLLFADLVESATNKNVYSLSPRKKSDDINEGFSSESPSKPMGVSFTNNNNLIFSNAYYENMEEEFVDEFQDLSSYSLGSGSYGFEEHLHDRVFFATINNVVSFFIFIFIFLD